MKVDDIWRLNRAEVRLRKDRQGYYDEKNGSKCASYSARRPAYSGTQMQASKGGTDRRREQK